MAVMKYIFTKIFKWGRWKTKLALYLTEVIYQCVIKPIIQGRVKHHEQKERVEKLSAKYRESLSEEAQEPLIDFARNLYRMRKSVAEGKGSFETFKRGKTVHNKRK